MQQSSPFQRAKLLAQRSKAQRWTPPRKGNRCASEDCERRFFPNSLVLRQDLSFSVLQPETELKETACDGAID